MSGDLCSRLAKEAQEIKNPASFSLCAFVFSHCIESQAKGRAYRTLHSLPTFCLSWCTPPSHNHHTPFRWFWSGLPGYKGSFLKRHSVQLLFKDGFSVQRQTREIVSHQGALPVAFLPAWVPCSTQRQCGQRNHSLSFPQNVISRRCVGTGSCYRSFSLSGMTSYFLLNFSNPSKQADRSVVQLQKPNSKSKESKVQPRHQMIDPCGPGLLS